MGVSERTIMGVMGWSNTAMTQRYAHVIDPIRRDTARRIDQLLWAEPQDGEAGQPAGPGVG